MASSIRALPGKTIMTPRVTSKASSMDPEKRRLDTVASVCLKLGLRLTPDRQHEIAEILRSLEAAQGAVDAWLERVTT